MNKERLRVLEMLQEGKITAEEAMGLLDRIPNDKEKTTQNHRDNREQQEDTQEEKTWWEETSKGIQDTIEQALDAAEDIDVNIILNPFNRGQQYMFFHHVPQGGKLNFLKLLAKNGGLKIKSHNDNKIKIEVKYNAKKGESMLYLQDNGGGLDLVYDYNAFRYLSIDCYIPRGLMIENIYAENKNSSIKLEDVTGGRIELVTTNSSIKLEDLKATEVIAQTTNSKISLERVEANMVRATTTNAKIESEQSHIEQLYAKTSNSSVKLQLNPDNQATTEDNVEYVVDVKTTNGNIKIEDTNMLPMDLNASTSRGKVDFDYRDVVLKEMSQNYIDCKSQNYDQASKKAKINLSTTNGNIKIV